MPERDSTASQLNMSLAGRLQAWHHRSVRGLKPVLKAAAPTSLVRWIQRVRHGDFTPPVGAVRFGDLRRLTPISRTYGYDRGNPIDRYLIEAFLQEHAALVQGHVLEIGDDSYTRRFGGDRVTRRDVLHAWEGQHATIVGDLTNLSNVASDTFDCMIITQTLHLIYDVQTAIRNIHRVLKPGGSLLATAPGLSQISDPTWRASWHWGFTEPSVRRLVTDVFPAPLVTVAARGNVLVSAAFLFGLSDRDLTKEELEFNDPDYQTLITVKATKPGPRAPVSMPECRDDGGKGAFPYGSNESYEKGVAFLDGHGTIEDWGCGTALARQFVRYSSYIGLDGTPSAFADRVVDLQTYRSDVDCILMRHVLEHHHGWPLILKNAVASFRRRMVLILSTPLAAQPHQIGETDGIPDLSLRRDDIVAFFAGLTVTEASFPSTMQYGREHIFFLEKA